MLKYEMQKQAYRFPNGLQVYRIKALRDFGHIKKGQIGGFVEEYDNLSHDGLCWIADNAMALGRSQVSGDALLRDRARLSGRACMTDRCVVKDDAQLSDFVFVYGHAIVGAQSVLAEVATVRDNAIVLCRARFSVSGKTRIPNVRGNAMVRDGARLEGSVTVRDDAVVADHAIVRDYARVIEKAYIGNEAILEGRATVGEEAVILHETRVGGRTKIYGHVLVTGKVTVLGKSYLTCRARLGGHGTIYDTKLDGDTCEFVGRRQAVDRRQAADGR